MGGVVSVNISTFTKIVDFFLFSLFSFNFDCVELVCFATVCQIQRTCLDNCFAAGT